LFDRNELKSTDGQAHADKKLVPVAKRISMMESKPETDTSLVLSGDTGAVIEKKRLVELTSLVNPQQSGTGGNRRMPDSDQKTFTVQQQQQIFGTQDDNLNSNRNIVGQQRMLRESSGSEGYITTSDITEVDDVRVKTFKVPTAGPPTHSSIRSLKEQYNSSLKDQYNSSQDLFSSFDTNESSEQSVMIRPSVLGLRETWEQGGLRAESRCGASETQSVEDGDESYTGFTAEDMLEREEEMDDDHLSKYCIYVYLFFLF